MIASLILVESKNDDTVPLLNLSLMNALQVVIGAVPGGGIILHVTTESPAYLQKALVEIAQLPDVTEVLSLVIRK